MSNMQTEQQEQNVQDMSPDEAAAALSFATQMSGKLMPQAPMEEQMEEQPQESMQTEEEPMQEPMGDPEKEAEMGGKFDQFKEDINKTIDDRFKQMAEMIKQALNDEDEE